MSSLSLDGPWRLGRVARQHAAFRSDDRAAVAAWLPATVPGNVHADLMRAGQLPDLYTAAGVEAARWVDGWDWWLECETTLALQPGERAFLCFDAIDYIATLWLDGHFLAHHEGAFARHTVEISRWLVADGVPRPLRVGARLWGAAGWPRPAWRAWERAWAAVARRLHRGKASLRPFHPRLRLLRQPMQAGWDFAPALPALGLWEGVRVEKSGGVRVEEVEIGDWRLGIHGTALGTVRLRVDAWERTEADLQLSWQPANFEGEGDEVYDKLHLPAGRSNISIPLAIHHARPWYPWEQGPPNLYQLSIALHPHTPHSTLYTLHSTQTRFGIRTLTQDHMRLTVNGRPFFARGVNWVPCDILPGTVARERYERLLGMARARGVNLVRVWGGGGRERREFYEVCNELGLLVWQEFPFACAFLDHYPRDAAFLQLAEQQARAMVRELRHHPSLAMWGAGNEFSRRRNRPLVDRLEKAVSQEDARPFLGPSPGPDDRHQWHLWHGLAPLHTLADETTPFLSEFGLQAPPARASLARSLPPAALWPPGPAWEAHHADLGKLRAYANIGSASRLHATRNTQHATLAGFVAASQRAQALAIQLGVERLRRRKAAGAGGVALWQWNEPWPAISWAVVDYFGEPKAAAETLRQCYHPLLLSLDWERRHTLHAGDTLRATVWAINDLSETAAGCEARLMQGAQCLWAVPLALPAHSAHRIEDIALTLPANDDLCLELWQGDQRLSFSRYPLALPGPQRLSPWRSLPRTLAEWLMRW